MVYVWYICGVCVVYVWCMCGISVVYVWVVLECGIESMVKRLLMLLLMM